MQSVQSSQNINWDEFETRVLEDNEIIQLSIYDKEKMYVYISVHPGPYKNNKRIADYVIDIEDVLWVEKRLN